MDKLYVQSLLQKIVNKEFTSNARRKINIYEDRINICCPICGDSSRSDYKKRGNLYYNRLLYICFKCGKKTSLDNLCKTFNEQIDPDKKLELISHLEKNISYSDYEDDVMNTSFDKIIDLSEINRIFNSGDYALTEFKPVQKNGIVYNYLCNRGIVEQYQRDIFEAKYWYNEDRYEPVLCILNRKGNKVLGVQIRNIKEGKRRMFKIYNYETLYKWVNGIEEITDIDINQLVVYNKMSYFFNILNIDFDSTITIFEGYIDSIFYPNSIGVAGVNTDFKILETSNLDIQYFFDNDSSGFEKSEAKIKMGYPVFLWKKLFESIVEKKKQEDPYKLMYRISKVKDLNKLNELMPNSYKKLDLFNFFSKDLMDIKYIPRKEYKYKRRTI
jgi:hypothetical protein